MKNILNKYDLMEAALTGIGLEPENVRVISLKQDGEYCELVLRTDWVMYDCYVDLLTGELAGLDSEPFVDVEATDGINCAELLKHERSRAA